MDTIGKLLEELRKEWPVITQAPILFGTATLAIIGAVWTIFQQMYKAIIERKNDLIKTLQDQLSSRSVPAALAEPPYFALQIDGGNFFIPDKMPQLTGILLDVLIINSGTPSIARDWKLSIIPPSGAPKAAQLTRIPPSLVARGEVNTAIVSASESFLESCLARSLDAGVPRIGELLFYIALPKPDVMQSVIELSVRDAKGNPFQVRKDLRDGIHL